MTWEDLLEELLTMKERDPDALKDEVNLVFDLDTIQYIELVYRLSTGKLSFVATFSPENLSHAAE